MIIYTHTCIYINNIDTYIPTYTCMVQLGYGLYSLSSFHHEFRRERKPDFAEEESVGLLKALRRGRRGEVT